MRIFRAFASLFDWQLKVGSPAWLAAAANDRARSHSSSLQFRLHFHRHFAPDYIFIVTLLQITFSSSLCSRLHSFSLCVRSLSLLLCAIRCMCSKTNFGSCARNFYKKFGPKKYSWLKKARRGWVMVGLRLISGCILVNFPAGASHQPARHPYQPLSALSDPQPTQTGNSQALAASKQIQPLGQA